MKVSALLKLSMTALFAMVALAATAHAAPSEVTVRSISYAGSGCPLALLLKTLHLTTKLSHYFSTAMLQRPDLASLTVKSVKTVRFL